MKHKKPKDEISPANLAKEFIRNNYDSKKTKSVVPIGPKFVITNPKIAQVKVKTDN